MRKQILNVEKREIMLDRLMESLMGVVVWRCWCFQLNFNFLRNGSIKYTLILGGNIIEAVAEYIFSILDLQVNTVCLLDMLLFLDLSVKF